MTLKTTKPNTVKREVALFVTCLIDLIRPSVGFSVLKLLEEAGCRVSVPAMQTCCGQPAYNSGDQKSTALIALEVIETFGNFDYVVVPSGSCAGMIKLHYPNLFDQGTSLHKKATQLANKTYEMTAFLSKDFISLSPRKREPLNLSLTYHDSCSGLRELDIKEQPRKLLKKFCGIEVCEGQEAETCCGFGGLFCIKYPGISEKIVDAKINDILATKAEMVVGGDLGCLMHIAGRLSRLGEQTKVRHIAELLSGMLEKPAIGQKMKKK